MVNDSAGPIMSFELQPGQMSHATTSGNMSMSMGSMGSMGSMSTGSSSK
jgi:hypothetical protein